MTYGVPPKKTLILNILDILNKYSDADHRLSVKDIGKRLERDYAQKVDRKSIRRNLINLLELGYDIEYSETARINTHGDEEIILSDWYINRTFTDAELRLLIDSLLFSKTLPYSQCRKMIEKLSGLSNRYFNARVRHIRTFPETLPENKQVFLTIEVLDEAITEGKQVAFHYSEYGLDKKVHPRKDGSAHKVYTVSPYQMAATNGRYYLICNRSGYPNISHYRVDRILDIQRLDTPVTPLKTLEGFENGLNLPRHMAEHLYMFTGESVAVVFTTKHTLIGDIIDWFGHDVNLTGIDEETVRVDVRVNESAMFYWSLQYGENVEVLKPESLRCRLAKAAREMAEKYSS